ncbi:ATP synthase F1 subunit gamma [Candidatus Falkowbacteria bacterium]|jgi:F-type H+-transporting ATPase subunit gamma|nr:ATP synthase F1 subunit gamma [Candidatus Falkowbacteria bacterium]MBT4433270.1 ATP synthase F1 subunit gamma [Candidatus Falkowbacteria bacterium]
MPVSTKDIQRRIKSVGNTKKITKAMEMVAASKMRRAVNMVIATRPYANLSWNTILNLSQTNSDSVHPLLQKKEQYKKILLVLISSNRGLCGGYNIQLVNKAIDSIKKHNGGEKITDIVTMGRKGAEIILRHKYNVVFDFPKPDLATGIYEVSDLSKMVIQSFLKGEYDKIMVAYTDFISSVNQVPRVKQLLPIDLDTEDDYLGIVGKDERIGLTKEFIKEKEEKYLKKGKYSFEYTFEPSTKEVLDQMIPRLIEIQLYQALLEANASEHSLRMLNMRNASDAAGEMIEDLTLYYNKARQASVTNEIAEISAGAAAMSG